MRKMTVNLADKISAVSSAESALQDLKRQIALEKREAAAAIDAKHADDLQAALADLSDARRALIAAQDQLPDHAWTGRRVFKMERAGRAWENRRERVDGIVETTRSTTHHPANMATYRVPEIGSPIVRLLRKDGKPGTRFERLNDWSGKPMWTLDESGEPKS